MKFCVYIFLFSISFLGNAQELKLFPPGGHTEDISSTDISKNSKYFITTSADKRVIVWEIATGKKVFEELLRIDGDVISVGFSPGNTYAYAVDYNRVHLWNVKEKFKYSFIDFEGDYGNVQVRFSINESEVLTLSGRTITLFDVQNDFNILWQKTFDNKSINEYEADRLSVFFSPNSQPWPKTELIVSTKSGIYDSEEKDYLFEIVLWNCKKNKVTWSLDNTFLHYETMAADRKYCLGTINKVFSRINFQEKSIIQSEIINEPNNFIFSSINADVSFVYVNRGSSLDNDTSNFIWNVKTGQVDVFFSSWDFDEEIPVPLMGVLNSNGESLYTLHYSDSLRVWDVKTKKYKKTIAFDNGSESLSINRALNMFITNNDKYIINLFSKGFSIIELSQLKENNIPREIDRNDFIEIEFNPNKNLMAFLSKDRVVVLNQKDGSVVFQLSNEIGSWGESEYTFIAFEFASDSILSIQLDDYNKQMWVNVNTGSIQVENSYINDAFFIDKGENIVTLSDSRLSIWTDDGLYIDGWTVTNKVTRSHFLASEKMYIIADDTLIRVIDRKDGEIIYVLSRPGGIEKMEWLKEGEVFIASGNYNNEDLFAFSIVEGEILWSFEILSGLNHSWEVLDSTKILFLASVSDEQLILTINGDNIEITEVFRGLNGNVVNYALNSVKDKIAIYTNEGSLYIHSLSNHQNFLVCKEFFTSESEFYNNTSFTCMEFANNDTRILINAVNNDSWDDEIYIFSVNSKDSNDIIKILNVQLNDYDNRKRGFLKYDTVLSYTKKNESDNQDDNFFLGSKYFIANEDGLDKHEVSGLMVDVSGSKALLLSHGLSIGNTSDYIPQYYISAPYHPIDRQNINNMYYRMEQHEILSSTIIDGKNYIVQNLNGDLYYWGAESRMIEKVIIKESSENPEKEYKILISPSGLHQMYLSPYKSKLVRSYDNITVYIDTTRGTSYDDKFDDPVGELYHFDYHEQSNLLVETVWGEDVPFVINHIKEGTIIEYYSDGMYMEHVEISENGEKIVLYSNWGDIDIIDSYGNRLLEINHVVNAIKEVHFYKDEKHIIITGEGRVVIWDIEKNQKMMEFSILKNGGLAVFGAEGRFDANQTAMNSMSFVYFDTNKNIEVIDFDQLKDRFWVPNLWKILSKGESLPELNNSGELKLQPKVEFGNLENGMLPINLAKRDGGYGKVAIFINGKEVVHDARGDDLDTSKVEQTIFYSIKDHPYLKDGNNTITVKASSADGFVQGRGIVIEVEYEAEVIVQPQFFGVVIGVGDYINDRINLEYPVKDAEAIATAIQLGAENLFGADRSFIYTISSAGDVRPSKTNIEKIFYEIAEKANSEDVIMIYLSGHGVTWGGDQGDFYFLTADATAANKEAYNDPIIRENNTISTAEWVELLKAIPALKQVMIIDACGSGKAIDNLLAARSIEGSQIKAIDRMKDRTGMYIISGCTADAVSYEASQYGQGLLTYSILEAMKGAALKPDGSVDVSLFMQHARERVPELAEGIGGIQQPQLLVPKGGSFDIGILDEEDQKAIPLASPKLVFVRSVFMNTEEMEDDLDLSSLLDEELGLLASKGAASSIVFFDAKKYPNACKISGGYTVEGDLIKVSLKIRCGGELENMELEAESKEELARMIVELIKGME